MRRPTRSILAAVAFLLPALQARAVPGYIGYSGAPGTHGSCAASCHGGSGGTIQVTGFPGSYVPNQAYTVTLSHNGGHAIAQFNGSCRIAAGSVNAGIISAGTNTATYYTSNETNGIHLSAKLLVRGCADSGTPAGGTTRGASRTNSTFCGGGFVLAV